MMWVVNCFMASRVCMLRVKSVVGRWRAEGGFQPASAIRYLVNARSFHLECSMVLHESFLVPILAYGSETMIWREKGRCRICAVQMDNLRSLLGIRRMNKVPNA